MPSGRESCALSPDPGGCPRQCRWELGSPRAHGRIRGSSPGGACGRPLELHQTLKDSLGVRRLLSEETGPRSHSLWPSSCPAPKVVPTPLFGPGPRLLPTFSPSSLPARSPAAVTHTLMSLFACLLPTECEPHQVRGPSLHRGRGPRAGSPARDTATEAGVSVRTGWARLRDKHAPAASDEEGFVFVLSLGACCCAGWGEKAFMDLYTSLRLLVPPPRTKTHGRKAEGDLCRRALSTPVGALGEAPGLSPAPPRPGPLPLPGDPAVPGLPHLDPGSGPPSTGEPRSTPAW